MKVLFTIVLITSSFILLSTACKKKDDKVVVKACYTHTTNETDVSFNADCSENASTYLWEFGIGVTSISKSPTVNYGYPGTYQVTLQVSGPNGQDTYTSNITIQEICVSCVCESETGPVTVGTYCGSETNRILWCVNTCFCTCE